MTPSAHLGIISNHMTSPARISTVVLGCIQALPPDASYGGKADLREVGQADSREREADMGFSLSLSLYCDEPKRFGIQSSVQPTTAVTLKQA